MFQREKHFLWQIIELLSWGVALIMFSFNQSSKAVSLCCELRSRSSLHHSNSDTWDEMKSVCSSTLDLHVKLSAWATKPPSYLHDNTTSTVLMMLRPQHSKSQWQKHHDIEENELQTILGLSKLKQSNVEPVGSLSAPATFLKPKLFNTPPLHMTTASALQLFSCELPGGRTYFLQVSTFQCQKLELVAIETALYWKGWREKSVPHCLTWVSGLHVCMCIHVWMLRVSRSRACLIILHGHL